MDSADSIYRQGRSSTHYRVHRPPPAAVLTVIAMPSGEVSEVVEEVTDLAGAVFIVAHSW